eukprot:SM000401S15616  [mRNA]  locus=s401:13549:14159:- [translate_table: standard]
MGLGNFVYLVGHKGSLVDIAVWNEGLLLGTKSAFKLLPQHAKRLARSLTVDCVGVELVYGAPRGSVPVLYMRSSFCRGASPWASTA